MQDNYSGPQFNKKSSSLIVPPMDEVNNLLVGCGKKLGIDYKPKNKEKKNWIFSFKEDLKKGYIK